VTFIDRRTFLFLANGQLFVREHGGEISEADAWERNRATILLGAQLAGELDPNIGMELVPPTDS